MMCDNLIVLYNGYINFIMIHVEVITKIEIKLPMNRKEVSRKILDTFKKFNMQ